MKYILFRAKLFNIYINYIYLIFIPKLPEPKRIHFLIKFKNKFIIIFFCVFFFLEIDYLIIKINTINEKNIVQEAFAVCINIV